MNIHSALDHLSASVSWVLTGRRRFFRDDTVCPDFPDLLSAIRLEGTELGGEGLHEVRATGPSEGLDPAHFDSADFYAPIMAGAAWDDVFISSAFRHLVGPAGRRNPDDLHRVLDFEGAFAARTRPNLRALLMRYDAFIEYERQSGCYTAGRVAVLEKGHTTGALASAAMRAFLLTYLADDP